MPLPNHTVLIRMLLYLLLFIVLKVSVVLAGDGIFLEEVLEDASGRKIFPTRMTFFCYAKMSIRDSLIIFLAISSELTL
jgi:hypothetical protein